MHKLENTCNDKKKVWSKSYFIKSDDGDVARIGIEMGTF